MAESMEGVVTEAEAPKTENVEQKANCRWVFHLRHWGWISTSKRACTNYTTSGPVRKMCPNHFTNDIASCDPPEHTRWPNNHRHPSQLHSTGSSRGPVRHFALLYALFAQYHPSAKDLPIAYCPAPSSFWPTHLQTPRHGPLSSTLA